MERAFEARWQSGGDGLARLNPENERHAYAKDYAYWGWLAGRAFEKAKAEGKMTEQQGGHWETTYEATFPLPQPQQDSPPCEHGVHQDERCEVCEFEAFWDNYSMPRAIAAKDVARNAWDACAEEHEAHTEAYREQARTLISEKEAYREQIRVLMEELARLREKGSPGIMHAVDEAFHKVVNERNYERARALRMENLLMASLKAESEAHDRLTEAYEDGYAAGRENRNVEMEKVQTTAWESTRKMREALQEVMDKAAPNLHPPGTYLPVGVYGRVRSALQEMAEAHDKA